MAKLFCQKCGRMFHGYKGTLTCDNCKVEEINRQRSQRKLTKNNKMPEEETVETPEEETPAEGEEEK